MLGADPRILQAATRTSPSRVLRVLLLACALAAVFGSAPLLAWTASLPDGQAARLLHDAAMAWNSAMSAAGATRPYGWVRSLVRATE
jgi:hypothetical protein